METTCVDGLVNLATFSSNLKISKLDLIEDDGVNLQCVNSSDFMVGKQTNFNGPVTIINYAEGDAKESPLAANLGKEEVVIKERIMAPSITSSMENFVKEKAGKATVREGTKTPKPSVREFCRRPFLNIPVFVWTLLLISIVAGCIVLIVELIDGDDATRKRSYITVNNKTYLLVTRQEWKALPPKEVHQHQLPVQYVVISHSGSQQCYSETKCGPILRDMQAFNMDQRNFPDIKYNFLVGGDGVIYEGRGWNVANENKGKVGNNNLDFCFMGNFVDARPTVAQTEAVKALVDYAKEMKYVGNYTLIPARVVNGSVSPGRNVVDIIKNWPNYNVVDVSDAETIVNGTSVHTIYNRRHWRAAPEWSSVTQKLPVPYVIVTSTGSGTCTGLKDCPKILHELQNFQTRNTGSDIYANFLISGDGSIFVGRGWNKRSPYQGYTNNRNIEIACIGEFAVYEYPTGEQTDAIKSLVDYGVSNGMIKENYTLIPGNATMLFIPGDAPSIGTNLYNAIKDFKGFQPDPYSKIFTYLDRPV